MIASSKMNKQLYIVLVFFSLLLIPLFIFKLIDLSKSNDVNNKTFVASGEIKTIKEKIVGDSNIKSSDGIYYYNGADVNNNLIFADICWQIVRTTENGGVKLIYNGLPVNGVCGEAAYDTSSYVNYIGNDDVIYNSNANLLTSVGYMYGNYDYGKINFLTDEAGVNFNGYWGASSTGGTSYYYGTGARWNSDGYYELINETKYDSTNYTMGLTHKYTCGSTSAGNTCKVVYIAIGGTSTASYVSLPPGKSYTALDYFKLLDGFENAGVTSQGNVSWAFSNSFSYTGIGGTFTLDYNSGNYTTYDMSDWPNNRTDFNKYHFTCFSTLETPKEVKEKDGFPDISVSTSDLMSSLFSGGELASKFYDITTPKVNTSCSELYYIFYSGSAGLYYLKLDNSMKTEDINNILTALNSGTYLDKTLLASNSISSNVKKVVDSWYDSYFANSFYEQYIVDEIYVNDRNLASAGGWNNQNDLTENITFNTYNGITSGFSEKDKFTLNTSIISSTNKELTVPVGLLSYDEAVLAGVTSTSPSYLGTRPFWLMSPHSYVEEASTTGASYDMVSYVYSINNGFTKSAVNSYNYVRPVISITSDMPVTGTGTEEDPYSLVYSVKYVINEDGPSITLPETINYKVGNTVLVDTSFVVGEVYNGYVFNGWTTIDVTISDGKFTMPDKAVTLIGSWSKVEYITPVIEVEVGSIYSNNVAIGDEVGFKISVTNDEDYEITDVYISVPVASDFYCNSTNSVKCTVDNDKKEIIVSSIAAGSTYSFSAYSVATEIGKVELEAKVTNASAESATFDTSKEYKDSDYAKTVAKLNVCNILDGNGYNLEFINKSVYQYYIKLTITENDTEQQANYDIEDINSISVGYWLVLEPNTCDSIFLYTSVTNGDFTYSISQLDKQENELVKVDGLFNSNGEKFTVWEPEEYSVTFFNKYVKKNYFHGWNRKENDIKTGLVGVVN